MTTSGAAGNALIARDDGDFFIELNRNCTRERASGLLCKRLALGLDIFGTFECGGGYECGTDGRWRDELKQARPPPATRAPRAKRASA